MSACECVRECICKFVYVLTKDVVAVVEGGISFGRGH